MWVVGLCCTFWHTWQSDKFWLNFIIALSAGRCGCVMVLFDGKENNSYDKQYRRLRVFFFNWFVCPMALPLNRSIISLEFHIFCCFPFALYSLRPRPHVLQRAEIYRQGYLVWERSMKSWSQKSCLVLFFPLQPACSRQGHWQRLAARRTLEK